MLRPDHVRWTLRTGYPGHTWIIHYRAGNGEQWRTETGRTNTGPNGVNITTNCYGGSRRSPSLAGPQTRRAIAREIRLHRAIVRNEA